MVSAVSAGRLNVWKKEFRLEYQGVVVVVIAP